MYKLIPSKIPHYYNEISQSQSIKFSIANLRSTADGTTEVVELFPKIKCRDFLCDVVKSDLEKVPVSIYGFNFDANKTPLDPEIFCTLVTIPKADERDWFYSNFSALTAIENRNGIIDSNYIVLDDKDNTILVLSHPFWRSTPWLISLHSWLLRLMTYPIPYSGRPFTWLQGLHENGPRTDDLMRLKIIFPKLEMVLPDLKAKRDETKYKKLIASGIGAWHNNSGIIGYLSQQSLPEKIKIKMPQFDSNLDGFIVPLQEQAAEAQLVGGQQ